ncbi:hypothetical protein RhiirA4_475475, partial [Rhizophagus irregularis]
MTRKKGPVWNHFKIIGNDNDTHPRVQCKYCPKVFGRACPNRMQEHFDKKKCQGLQQYNFINHLSESSKLPNKDDNIDSNLLEIYKLGCSYLYGTETEKNEIKAFKLFEATAEKSHLDSIRKLGHCYQHGKGTKKDEIKAFELYNAAAEM